MGRLVLILGGARSGKSTLAEEMARDAGDRVAFVATAEARDDEMRLRIAAHQAARPAMWRTIEEPLDLDAALDQAARESDVVVVDCLTLWVSNHLCRLPEPGPEGDAGQDPRDVEATLRSQFDRIVQRVREGDAVLIVVSNEVGLGLVPDNALGRSYRDLLGAVNRWFAAEADQALLMIAGLPIDLKRFVVEGPR